MATFFPGTTSDLLTIFGNWTVVEDPTPDYPRIPGMEMKGTRHGQFLAIFRGTMFSLHISHPPGSSVTIWLDGKLSTLPFVPEAESVIISLQPGLNSGLESMSVVENMITLGDHQLLVLISSNKDLVVFDRLDFWFPSDSPTPTNHSM
ncbi:hypothetical protein FRC17_008832, partial [Serendipita sp. 399]